MKKILLTSSLLFAGALSLVGSDSPQDAQQSKSKELPNFIDTTPEQEKAILKLVKRTTIVKALLTEAEKRALGKIEEQLEEYGVIDIGDTEKKEIKDCIAETGVWAVYPYVRPLIEDGIDAIQGEFSPAICATTPIDPLAGAIIKKCIIGRYPRREWKRVESITSKDVSSSEPSVTTSSSNSIILDDSTKESQGNPVYQS